jgi:hypothetical protein
LQENLLQLNDFMLQNILVKKSLLFFLLFFIAVNVHAQTGIFFQAIARDNTSNPAKDRKIYVQTNIIQSSPTGTKVLTEEHQTYTDAYGIFSIMVGNGSRVGGTVSGLSTIDWSKGPYYLNLKIVITPIAASNTWDYSKEWVDIGTTIFGTVPFALYSANTAKIDEKLNASDTSKMLNAYAKAQTVQTLATTIDTKLATKDTSAMLAPYAKLSYNLDSNYLKKQITSLLGASDSIKYTKQTFTDSALLKKMNIFDTSIYAKQTFVDAVTYSQQKFIDLSLQSKLNIADTIKYTKLNYTDSILLTKMNNFDTSVYAKKIIVDAALATKFNVTDTIKYTKQNYTDSALSKKLNVYDTSVYAKKIVFDAALITKLNNTDTIKYTKKAYSDSALATKLNYYDTSIYAKQAYVDAINYIEQEYLILSLQSKLDIKDTIKYTKKTYSDSALLTKLNTSGSAAGLTNFPILNQNTSGNAATATYANSANMANSALTAGNITATSNITLTNLTNLNTVGTIKTGVWSATTIDIAHGGTGITTAGRIGQVLATASDGTLTWTSLTTQTATHSIGESFGGGIVFYVWDYGRHGLISATSNLSFGGTTGFTWGPTANYVMAIRNGINAGMSNTERIIIKQGAGIGNYAAMVAAHYQFNGNGWGDYGDWYLPSIYELQLLFKQKNVVGGFTNTTYVWSSNEADDKTAYTLNFFSSTGTVQAEAKNLNPRSVRAIRSF